MSRDTSPIGVLTVDDHALLRGLGFAALQIIGVGAGILLLVGLWTPVAGTLAAIAQLWIASSRFFSHFGDPWTAIVEAALGAILAMVGPGAWSI
jgi:hypothetical protein